MTNTVKDKLTQSEIQASFPYLIEVWKSSDTEKEDVLRYVNSTEDKEFEGHTFTAAYFKLTPPEKTEAGIKDARITISSIDQSWIERIREADERYKIRFIAVIVYDDDGNEFIEALDDITFVLTNATWNETSIQWTMKFDEGLEINMPCQKMTQFICPALF